jgi:uncharacterized membrane protein YkvA (DUF1232 family)
VEIDTLRTSLPSYVESHVANRESAVGLADDLRLLHRGWESRSEEAQRIVRAVTVYFLEAEDGVPDYYLSGLADDDHVIAAAFTALGLDRDESRVALDPV